MLTRCRRLLAVPCAAALALAERPPLKPYEIVTLADGLYGFVWSNPVQDPIEGNALFIGSYYREWIATLGRLDWFPADMLFLGHGQPQRTRDYLHQVHGLLTALVERVDSAVAGGGTLEETRQAVTLSDWKTAIAGDDPRLQGGFDTVFVTPAVGRAWDQAKGNPDDVSRAE